MALVDLVMPKLGESIMEATVLKWTKKVGEKIKQDETLLEIATDKVDSEVPSTAEGVLSEILFSENDVVPIGVVIARIETDVAVASQPVKADNLTSGQGQHDEESAHIPYVPSPVNTAAIPNAGSNKFYSPLVLNIANSEGVAMSELEHIPGTGNEGRVTKRDILQYVADKKTARPSQQPEPERTLPKVEATPQQPAPAPTPVVQAVPSLQPASQPTADAQPSYTAPTGNVEIIEMDRMRKMIAKHMVNSKQVSPHVTSFAEADVTNMVMWRERVKKQFEKQEATKITFTPMFIACITKVIKRYPYINCSVDGDKIILKKDINIGMATALPSGNLIVPVIKNADYLNLVGLSKQVNNLAESARNNRLRPDDTNGGTFTVTNVGTFGSLMGTPIINQPQVAILAVGVIKKRPVVIETAEGDAIGIRHMMYLSLSYDHRVVDGSIGASFLTEVAREFENWDLNREW
jgi:2-oxoglutarate dehydrogenase E2 component (dihydrolipoamide succinyltransferase)